MTSQCLRLLKSGDNRYTCHIDYWLGPLVGNITTGMGLQSPSTKDNSYFVELGDNLASLMVSDVLTPESLNKLNNRQIYKSFSDFDIPKIVREAPSNADYDLAWKRLHSPYVRMDSRDIMYMLLHNKVPTPERLIRIGMKNDPYCLHCQKALVCDIEHLFCCCVRTEVC